MEKNIKEKNIKKDVQPVDMNKTFFLKKEAAQPQWKVIDAKGQVLGRLATQIADILRGKDEAYYTPHTFSGDYVVVINAKDILFTGNKLKDKIYARYTGWMGGYRETTAGQMMQKDPARVIELAVRGMLPKNRLSRQILRKLKVFAGAEHTHIAQVNAPVV